MTVLDDLERSHYVSLTTYRKDGTPVATPVWHVVHDEDLFILSETDTWKIKRIRRNSHVMVTACNIRGKVAPGAPSAEGTARLVDEAGTQAVRALIARKYRMARMGNWLTRVLRIRRPPATGIAVTLVKLSPA